MVDGRDIQELCFEVQGLDFNIQGIFASKTKRCVAGEILFDKLHRLGFNDASSLFNFAKSMQSSNKLSAALLQRTIDLLALHKATLPERIFINVDNAALSAKSSLFPLEKTRSQIKELDARLVIEISEREQMNFELWLFHKKDWNELGIEVALDDFGVGFSSLQMLHKIGPDVLKVDQYFIKEVQVDGLKRKLLKHLLALTKDLGITLICEGVESEAEFAILRELGVEYVQGFLFERPKILGG